MDTASRHQRYPRGEEHPAHPHPGGRDASAEMRPPDPPRGPSLGGCHGSHLPFSGQPRTLCWLLAELLWPQIASCPPSGPGWDVAMPPGRGGPPERRTAARLRALVPLRSHVTALAAAAATSPCARPLSPVTTFRLGRGTREGFSVTTRISRRLFAACSNRPSPTGREMTSSTLRLQGEPRALCDWLFLYIKVDFRLWFGLLINFNHRKTPKQDIMLLCLSPGPQKNAVPRR